MSLAIPTQWYWLITRLCASFVAADRFAGSLSSKTSFAFHLQVNKLLCYHNVSTPSREHRSNARVFPEYPLRTHSSRYLPPRVRICHSDAFTTTPVTTEYQVMDVGYRETYARCLLRPSTLQSAGRSPPCDHQWHAHFFTAPGPYC